VPSGAAEMKGAIRRQGEIALVSRDENKVTVADIVQIYVREASDDLVHRAIQVPALAADLRTYFQEQSDRRGQSI
jgi:MOSC domain-containing protein YiiM